MRDALIDRLQAELPVRLAPHALAAGETGLVIANASATPRSASGGPLPGLATIPRAGAAIACSERLAHRFVARRWPVLAFIDGYRAQHGDAPPDVPRPAWLPEDADVAVVRKECVSGFVGAIEAVHHGTHGSSHNRLVDWVNLHRLRVVLVGGLFTDICVLDLVLPLLSARAHGMMPTLRDIVVLEPATATYGLSPETAAGLDLPATTAHPEQATHHLGLYLMASRGALLASEVTGRSSPAAVSGAVRRSVHTASEPFRRHKRHYPSVPQRSRRAAARCIYVHVFTV